MEVSLFLHSFEKDEDLTILKIANMINIVGRK